MARPRTCDLAQGDVARVLDVGWPGVLVRETAPIVRCRLAAFEARYNAIARPFSWKFTRTDRDDLLRRIDAHDWTQPHTRAACSTPPTNLRDCRH
jgi:hypothetical protein